MMSRIYLRLSSLALLTWCCASMAASVERGNLIFDNIPAPTPDMTEQLDRYLGARQATPLGWSPKGQLLIETRFGEVDQLHLVERAGGARQQLTFFREPVTHAAFSPEVGRAAYVYSKDTDGGGKPQLFYQHLDEPSAKRLTDGKSVNGGAVWSNNGHEIAFFTTARDGISYDIALVEPELGAPPRTVLAGDGAEWTPLDWSPDDRRLLVLRSVSRTESNLYVVDVSSGQRREVDAAPTKVGIINAKFSRDGQGVYFVSDRDTEFLKLRYINLFTGDKSVISAPINWDIEELAISRDGHYLAYVSNEGGLSKLNIQDLRSHQDLTPPKLPGAGVIDSLCFDAEGKRLAFGFATATQPHDAFVLELSANRVEQWTQSETGATDVSKFVTPRLTQFPTFDRQDGRPRAVPVYLLEPATVGPHPVLIVLRGGPDEQFRPSFDPWIQYVVNELGFAVAAPNVRGSSGYGKTFSSLDNGVAREDAVKDMGALIVWLGLQHEFDAKHVVVSGSSYGGYLALAALVNYSDRLRGGVDVMGMTDFVSFLANSPPYAQARARSEYGDERDPDTRAYLRRISPLTSADRMLRPLLIVHGRNAARVPSSESDQLVNRLRSHGGEVWFLQARDEADGFTKQSNREVYYRVFAQFLTMLK